MAALVSGTLTAVAMLYAKEVSSPEQTARAISAVYAGFSVAAVAGCPSVQRCATLLVGGHLWRDPGNGTGAAAGAGPAAAAEIDVPPAEGGLLNQFAVLRDSRCWHCVLMVLFSASATYTVYTYLTPTLTGTLGLPETAVSPVLLVMGLCSAASNLFSGCLAEKGGLKPLPLFFAAQVLLFAVLPLLLVNRWLGLTGLFAMGLLMYLLNTPVQVHSLGLAEAEYPAAASLCASVQPVSYNLASPQAPFAGSLVQDAWGLRLLGVPAAVFALLSLWQCKGLLRSIQRGKTSR